MSTTETENKADSKYKLKRGTFCSKKCMMSLFPILQWLPLYKLSYLKRDLLAGITVSILGVPQALAYAILAGLPAEWGLYASIIPIAMYVIWGTSTQIALGTVATTCIMIATAVETIMINHGYNDENDREYQELYQSIVITLAFVCGIVRIIFGLIRVGFIVVFLSRPVMTGFIFSVALIILINQFRGLLGLNMERYPLFYQTLIAVFSNITSINWYNTLISFISLFLLFLPKWIKKIPKWIPMPLIVIILFSSISYCIGTNTLQSMGISLIGNDIKPGLPALKVPNLNYIDDVWRAAVIIAVVSYMGSIALAKEFEQKVNETYKQELNAYNIWYNNNNNNSNTPSQQSQIPLISITEMGENEDMENKDNKDKNCNINKALKPLPLANITVDGNMEFIAYGMANMLGCFFSGMIVSGSFSRSALKYEMNACTQIASAIQAFICLLCLLFLMPLLAPLPKCVLASVVTISIYRLIKNGIYEFKFLFNVSRIELIEFSVAVISPLIVGLEIGILISIASSIIVNLLRHSFAGIIYLGQWKSKISDSIQYIELNNKQIINISHIIIIEMKAELAFINNNRLVDKLRKLLNEGNKYIIISLKLSAFIDTTAIREIVTIFEDAKNSYICLSECKSNVIELINRYQKDEQIFPQNIKLFISTNDAVTFLNSIYNDNNNNNNKCKVSEIIANDDDDDDFDENIDETTDDESSVDEGKQFVKIIN